jgi:hypothetical protein
MSHPYADILLSITSALTKIERGSQEERINAYHFCENLKNNPNAFGIGLFLFQNEVHISHRHLGLNLMYHAITYNWKHLDNQEEIISLVNNIIINCQDKEPLYIINKLASLYSGLLLHVFPQRLKFDALEMLLHPNSNEKCKILALTILRFFSEEMMTSESNKEHLRNSLVAFFSPFPSSVLPKEIFASCGVLSPRKGWMSIIMDFVDDKYSVAISLAAILVISVYSEWFPVSCTNHLNIIPRIFKMIDSADDSIRQAALDCLMVFVQRNFGSWENFDKNLFHFLMNDESISLFQKLWASSSSDIVFYPFQKSLLELLINLLNSFYKRAPENNNHLFFFHKWIAACLIPICNYPSIYLSRNALRCLSNLKQSSLVTVDVIWVILVIIS